MPFLSESSAEVFDAGNGMVYRVNDGCGNDPETVVEFLTDFIGTDLKYASNIYDCWLERGHSIILMEKLYEIPHNRYTRAFQHLLTSLPSDVRQILGEKLGIQMRERHNMIIFSCISRGILEVQINLFDLHLGNVMMTRKGEYKIIDWWDENCQAYVPY
jgi:hypothetical protein